MTCQKSMIIPPFTFQFLPSKSAFTIITALEFLHFQPQRSRNHYVLSKIVLFAFWRQNSNMIFRPKIGQKSVNLVNELIF